MSSGKKCLVIDPMHPGLFPMLQALGWEVDYLPDLTRDQVRERLQGYVGLIVRSKTFVDRDLLGDRPTLRFVGRAGAGIDNLDMDFLLLKGIRVVHAAEGNRDAVAEYCIGALLSLMRNIPRGDAEVRNFVWERERNRGEELMGKTVGIIGYGNMGQAFARRLSGFGCKVLVYDKYKRGFGDTFCGETQMEAIFAQTDILSLHIPLTAETRMMVNDEYLRRFEKKIILLNSSRGEIVSLQHVSDAMEAGKVRGAVLDVLENEKLTTLTPLQRESFNSLRSRSNVIFTPHIAGWTFESHEKINVALVNKIKELDIR